MARPVVFIDTSSPLKRRLILACAAGAAVGVVIWWTISSATAEHAPSAQPAKAQWAGSASPFAVVSAGSTAPVSPTTEPATAVAPTAPAAAPPAAPPAETHGAPGLDLTPTRLPSRMAGARGDAEAPDTEAEN